jgi:hypothetical protein
MSSPFSIVRRSCTIAWGIIGCHSNSECQILRLVSFWLVSTSGWCLLGILNFSYSHTISCGLVCEREMLCVCVGMCVSGCAGVGVMCLCVKKMSARKREDVAPVSYASPDAFGRLGVWFSQWWGECASRMRWPHPFIVRIIALAGASPYWPATKVHDHHTHLFLPWLFSFASLASYQRMYVLHSRRTNELSIWDASYQRIITSTSKA